jgi:hypothetical protein
MTHNLCADRGTLADVRFPIPVDANTFAYKGIDRVVPCSHLRCASCEVALKWLDGRRIEGGPSALAAAWDADDTTRSAGAVETDAGWRFYFCRCQSFLCITAVSLHLAGDLDLRLELPTSWACGGHPTRDLPTTLGGVELPADPDWRAIVARSFKAEAPDGAPHFWARWLPEVYGQLSGTPHPQAINSVIADLMVSSDDALRTGALYFLWDSLDVPAVDLLPHVLLEDAETLHGQRDARGPTSTTSPAAWSPTRSGAAACRGKAGSATPCACTCCSRGGRPRSRGSSPNRTRTGCWSTSSSRRSGLPTPQQSWSAVGGRSCSAERSSVADRARSAHCPLGPPQRSADPQNPPVISPARGCTLRGPRPSP